jgi:hypothetical protein
MHVHIHTFLYEIKLKKLDYIKATMVLKFIKEC